MRRSRAINPVWSAGYRIVVRCLIVIGRYASRNVGISQHSREISRPCSGIGNASAHRFGHGNLARYAGQCLKRRKCVIGGRPGKVAAKFLGRGDRKSCAYPLHHPVALIIPEEKYLVAFNRPAEGTAKLILMVRSPRRNKIIASIQVGIAEKLEQVAVIPVGSRFRDDVDLPAAIVAVFGVEVIGDNAKLRDRVQVGNDRRTAETGLLHDRSIEEKSVVCLPHAVYREISRVKVARHRGHSESCGYKIRPGVGSATSASANSRGSRAYARL